MSVRSEGSATTATVRVTHPRIDHVELTFEVDCSTFCARLEGSLGRFTESIRSEATSPEDFRTRVEGLAGDHGLLLFDIRDHGALLRLVGRPANGKQYLIGNPLVAVRMTTLDLRAGLYAPARVFVYQPAPGRTRIEYDLPSTQFGQWGSPEILDVGERLDRTLLALIQSMAEST